VRPVWLSAQGNETNLTACRERIGDPRRLRGLTKKERPIAVV
jgi:hypothetical protein